MRARAEYEQQLAEQGSDEDADELEVFEDGEGGAEDEDVPEAKSSKDKGKGRATEATDRIEAASAKKRRRPAVDPFAGTTPRYSSIQGAFLISISTGYGDNQDTKAAKSPKKKKQVSAATEGDDVAMGDEAVSGSNTPTSTPSSTKKDKSNTKKTKKKPRKSS